MTPPPRLDRRCSHARVLTSLHTLQNIGPVSRDARGEVGGVRTATLNQGVINTLILIALTVPTMLAQFSGLLRPLLDADALVHCGLKRISNYRHKYINPLHHKSWMRL